MRTAAIYARVSSEKQKEEQTIDSQTALLREYAQDRGYAVPSKWIFQDEGYSGALLVRPGLERVRDLAGEGQIEAVLVYSPDRLSRKYAYQVLLLEEFARQGVEVIFLRAPQVETPEDQLLVQFQGMIAEYERAQIAERTRRGKKHRAKAGLINVLSGSPYGYRYVKKTETSAAFYEVIEAEAAVVREVYRLYTEQGLSMGQITRELNAQGIFTRTRKSQWERSTVWAMLRNPAYKGSACFGKTERVERKKITRALRRRSGFSPRCSANRERPEEEWIKIAVPAIISEESFALARERLEQNKHFARRHTKEATLLQGFLVCSLCGYSYYRTSTRTSRRKLYYYRCLGSDRYRYLNKKVCPNRPIRQDYLDEVVWRQVVELLENPELVRREIDRRIREIQESNPSKMRKEALIKERERVRKGSERLVDAYQEGLLSLRELRRRIPDLRKREEALQSQIQALETTAVDQGRYLQLADNIEGFLGRMHRSAETLNVMDRQKILRLLVKEIYVSPDTLTIKHSIPTSTPTGYSNVPSYLLRGGSDIAAAQQYLPALRAGPVVRARGKASTGGPC
jgi:site-specific DNA recombinase